MNDKALKIKHNYVYLIREREFMRLKEPIYKIGKTTQLPNTRLAGYPKGSEILLYIDVENCHNTEKSILAVFDTRYKCRRDIGREYYEGDLNDMKRAFFKIVDDEFTDPYILPGNRPSWAWRMYSGTSAAASWVGQKVKNYWK